MNGTVPILNIPLTKNSPEYPREGVVFPVRWRGYIGTNRAVWLKAKKNISSYAVVLAVRSKIEVNKKVFFFL